MPPRLWVRSLGMASSNEAQPRGLNDMQIRTLDQALAILISLTDEQIESLPPAERRRVSDQCMRVAIKCAPLPPEPKAGVLYDLRAGKREDH
jgi:hypothetical protein